MISYWDFQDCGMQVTKLTPLYFAEHGHRIHFFVHSEQTAHPSKIRYIHSNVDVWRFEFPLKFLSRIPKINRLRQLLFFMVTCIISYLKLYGWRKKLHLIYAAESDAILIGSLLARIHRVPFVTRYYGISRILLEKPLSHFLYLLSLHCKADLAIVTDDGTNGEALLKSINARIKEVKFWRNGIEKIRCDPLKISQIRRRYNLSKDDFVLLTVSRLYGWKRVDRAIRVMQLLLSLTQKRIKLLVVGDGPHHESLKELGYRLRVSNYVVFAGAVEHKEIYNFYALANVFLSLCDMSNAGNPILEALSAGKCIVTLDTGDTSNIIKDGQNGILVEIEKDENRIVEKLASTIINLIENESLREKLEIGAKEYAEKHIWTWNERLDTELRCIEELIQHSSRRGCFKGDHGIGRI